LIDHRFSNAVRLISLLVLTQISTSVRRTMADVALMPAALTQRAVVRVSVYLAMTAMESPARVCHRNHSSFGFYGVLKSNLIFTFQSITFALSIEP